MGSSNFVSKTACPRCRLAGRDNRGDNLAVYDDDHRHCFACGFYVPANAYHRIRKKVLFEYSSNELKALPNDLTDAIDHEALTWLSKYDIEKEELFKHSIRWSPSQRLLTFSFYNKSQELNGWQARNFNTERKNKWLTYGIVDDLMPFHLTKDRGNAIILVEDVVSGIKIDRQFNVVPLFGSTISHRRLTQLKYLTEKVIFWLDFDKRSTSIFLAKVAQSLGLKTGIIVTDDDPKCYSNQEITDFVSPHLEGVN